MYKKTTLVPILLILAVVISCQSDNQNIETPAKKIHKKHHHKTTTHHHKAFEDYPTIENEEIFNTYHSHSKNHESLKVELTNNIKVKSDTNTYIGMNHLKAELDGFIITDKSTLKNYHDVGYSCKKDAIYILTHSKIEGSGYTIFHDLIHIIVLDIKNIGYSKNVSEAKQHFDYLNEDIITFFENFEPIVLTENQKHLLD